MRLNNFQPSNFFKILDLNPACTSQFSPQPVSAVRRAGNGEMSRLLGPPNPAPVLGTRMHLLYYVRIVTFKYHSSIVEWLNSVGVRTCLAFWKVRFRDGSIYWRS